jgi:hypothetical protein
MIYNKASTYVFKHNDKWYKISLRIDKVDITSAKDSSKQNLATD